jgi:hypothetical protein
MSSSRTLRQTTGKIAKDATIDEFETTGKQHESLAVHLPPQAEDCCHRSGPAFPTSDRTSVARTTEHDAGAMGRDAVSARPTDFIDTDRYPITEAGPARDALIDRLRGDLVGVGCAVLKGFIRPERITELVAECDSVAEHGHRNFNRTNPYFTQDRPDLPERHPLRRFYDRSNAFVPADHFGPDSILRQIYEWPAFAPFIQAALNEDRFYPYADPLADVIVNTAEAGNGFPWHFDTNNYTVTLAIQNAEAGGDFEYSPHLRTPLEENYSGVEAVLDGDTNLIRTLRLEPGDLQIFKGRYSLHRVTPLAGLRPRYVAIFSYVEEPGMVGSPERAAQLYGRVLPIHLERAGLRADALVD